MIESIGNMADLIEKEKRYSGVLMGFKVKKC